MINNNPLEDHALSAYDFEVPPELIAQEPLAERDASRLLVLHRRTGALEHRLFRDIVGYLAPGDCLVINQTRVVPVRLRGAKETGGGVDALLLDPREFAGGTVRALVKPRVGPGTSITFAGGVTARVQEKTPAGETVLSFHGPELDALVASAGQMPLPPYIKRDKGGDARAAADRHRYQTVYAASSGSIAAPTAGLHFTEPLLNRVRDVGVDIARITLHVGWGTFRPLVAQTVTDHVMLPERYEVTPAAAEAVNRARRTGKRVIAVGTTSVRTLESAGAGGELIAGAGETSLFIHPGHTFKIVTGLITNFHQPQSTPLVLTSAFAGRRAMLDAYREAVSRGYRFFSYGDAMLIL